MKINKITLVFPYYNNPEMLEHQIKIWDEYNDHTNISIILVDDGSKISPALPIVKNRLKHANCTVITIDDDIPWNHHGARNLGMLYASDWVIITDIDHVIPSSTLNNLLHTHMNVNSAYLFPRISTKNKTIKTHPNTFLIHLSLYWRVGGYDETYTGYYGTDISFRRALKRFSGKPELLSDPVILFDLNDITDANTTSLSRGKEYHVCRSIYYCIRRYLWFKPKVNFNSTWSLFRILNKC